MEVTILHMTYQLLCLGQHDIWWSSPTRQAASVADRGRLSKAGMIAQGGLYMQVSIGQYCGQNLSNAVIDGAVVTKRLIDGAEFFQAALSG